jgi:hypothetical protein
MFRNFSMLNAEEKEHALLNEVGELLICMSSTTTSDADGLNQNMVINLWTLAFDGRREDRQRPSGRHLQRNQG